MIIIEIVKRRVGAPDKVNVLRDRRKFNPCTINVIELSPSPTSQTDSNLILETNEHY